MGLFDYIDAHPIYTFFLGFYVLILVALVGKYCLALPLRALSIWIRGWPPPHIDADGETVKQKEPTP